MDRCCHHHSHTVRDSSAVSAAAAVGYLSHSAIPAEQEEEHSSVAAAGTLGDETAASADTGHDEDWGSESCILHDDVSLQQSAADSSYAQVMSPLLREK